MARDRYGAFISDGWLERRARAYAYDGRVPPPIEVDERGIAREARDDTREHQHVWGPVEHARLTGNPHRKCQGCRFVSLDLDDDDDEEEDI